MIRKFWDWLTMADYDAAKERSSWQVVARFSRGNVLVQRGCVLDEVGLRALSLAGDKAMARLARKIPT